MIVNELCKRTTHAVTTGSAVMTAMPMVIIVRIRLSCADRMKNHIHECQFLRCRSTAMGDKQGRKDRNRRVEENGQRKSQK